MKLKILLKLKICLMATVISLNACAFGGKKKTPVWNGKIYTGDSSRGSVRRDQDNEEISCMAPAFDEFKCFTDEGFKSWVKTYVKGCKKWK